MRETSLNKFEKVHFHMIWKEEKIEIHKQTDSVRIRYTTRRNGFSWFAREHENDQ